MIYSREGLQKVVSDHRKEVRSVYREGYGQKELFNIFHDAGLFRVIRPEELDARNRAIMKAEELGMLDEDIVRTMISYYFSLPIDSMEDKKVVESNKNMEYDYIEDNKSNQENVWQKI